MDAVDAVGWMFSSSRHVGRVGLVVDNAYRTHKARALQQGRLATQADGEGRVVGEEQGDDIATSMLGRCFKRTINGVPLEEKTFISWFAQDKAEKNVDNQMREGTLLTTSLLPY